MSRYCVMVNRHCSPIKHYDLGSGYLGEMPIAKIQFRQTENPVLVYSAECLLNDIEKEGDLVRIYVYDNEVGQFADAHREDLIL